MKIEDVRKNMLVCYANYPNLFTVVEINAKQGLVNLCDQVFEESVLDARIEDLRGIND